MPNERAKDLQCHIGHQKFQSSVNSDLDAFIEKRGVNILMNSL